MCDVEINEVKEVWMENGGPGLEMHANECSIAVNYFSAPCTAFFNSRVLSSHIDQSKVPKSVNVNVQYYVHSVDFL